MLLHAQNIRIAAIENEEKKLYGVQFHPGQVIPLRGRIF